MITHDKVKPKKHSRQSVSIRDTFHRSVNLIFQNIRVCKSIYPTAGQSSLSGFTILILTDPGILGIFFVIIFLPLPYITHKPLQISGLQKIMSLYVRNKIAPCACRHIESLSISHFRLSVKFVTYSVHVLESTRVPAGHPGHTRK